MGDSEDLINISNVTVYLHFHRIIDSKERQQLCTVTPGLTLMDVFTFIINQTQTDRGTLAREREDRNILRMKTIEEYLHMQHLFLLYTLSTSYTAPE